MGYFVKKDLHGNKGFVLNSGTTSQRPDTPIQALMRYNIDTDGIEYFNGTQFVQLAKAGRALTPHDKFTSDGITNPGVTDTVFTMSIDYTSATAPDTSILVFVGGLLQSPPFNYTVTGNVLTLGSPAPDQVKVVVVHNIGGTFVNDADVF